MALTPELTLLVLVAALAHAAWNALVKTSADKLAAMAAMLVPGAIMGALALPFVEVPAVAAWPYLAASVVIHNAYFALVVLGYRAGDLSLVYPLARGSAPAVVAILAWVFVGETLGLWGWIGLVLASVGIGALAMGGGPAGRPTLRAVALALATGILIAGYTVTDGIGMRVSGAPFGYIAWAFLIWSVAFVAVVFGRRRGRPVASTGRFWATAGLSGTLSAGAYGIVLYALASGPMADVSALRETSVLFAAAIGAVRLKEPFGGGRIVAASAIVVGLIMLKLRS